MTRTDLLNYLIDRHGYKTYLEIGVDNGKNFHAVRVTGGKVCVDPNCPASYKMTSDKFFEVAQGKYLFDLIFIDGLHEETQVIRDIENSLKLLSPNGTIVVHDCNPQQEKHQSEKRGDNSHWNGTVWKGWVKVRSSHDDLTMTVLDMDEGCGIIQRGTQAKIQMPEFLDWAWFDRNRKHALNLVSFEEWKSGPTDAFLFQYWDKDPPGEVLSWMNTWQEHHQGWQYLRLNEESARDYIRYDLGSRYVNAYDSCLLAASKSNILRYCMLYSRGGVWADSDLECGMAIDGIWAGAKRGVIVREARPVASLPIKGFIKPNIGETEIRNDFLIFKKPGDKLVERMLHLSLMNIENSDGSTGTSWNFTGPGIWCDLFKHNESAFDGMNVMWYHDIQEWKYHEHSYKKKNDYWMNVQKGTPIFKTPQS